MKAIAKKEFNIDGRTFVVRIDTIAPIEKNNYVQIDWSVESGDFKDDSTFRLQDGDQFLKDSGYSNQDGTLKPRVLALKLFSLLDVEEKPLVKFSFWTEPRSSHRHAFLLGDSVAVL